jgi:hypothetical protein
MRDYKKSANGRPVTSQGKSIAQFAEGGAVATQPKKSGSNFMDAFRQYSKDQKAGVRYPWQFGKSRSGGGGRSSFFLMGFIPYLKNYKKPEVPK